MTAKKAKVARTKPALRNAIISHLGELTQDTRAVGDRIRYRIYYANTTRNEVDILITDVLDKGLAHVTVLNGGRYNTRSRAVTWTLTAVPPGHSGFVELEAIIGSATLIRNQAFAEGLGARRIQSNTVVTKVIKPPKLGWIPFLPDAKEGEPTRVWMKDETTMGATVRIDLPGVFVYEQKVDGVAYQRLVVPGRAVHTDIGKPELPLAGEFIEVPFGVNFTPEIVDKTTTKLDGYNVYPAQPPRIEAPAGRPSPFQIDKATYLSRTAYPPALAGVANEDIGVIRGHRVAGIKANPFQYNPVTRQLAVHPMLEVRLKFDHPAQLERVDHRLESPAFEDFLKATVLNYKDPRRFYRPQSEGGSKEVTGCDYLIITHDDFYKPQDANNPIVRLAAWKQRKGYRTKVVKVGSISGGNTAASIRAYIQNAYDHWNPVPTYVLLVGDADLVRPTEGLHHPDENNITHPQPQVESDLFYGMVDGTDYFPDIYIGRLSADSVAEVTNIVDKILAYEQTPPATPANAAFYTDVSLVSLFTDSDGGWSLIDGWESRPWIANVETIRNYLQGQGYTAERIYATDSGFPANPLAQSPQQFNDGTNLPNDLLSPQYGWNGSTADITAALNAGRFLIAYRAHGNPESWDQPSFGNNQVAALNQNDLTPVVFSITCQTGWFDNETDDQAHGGRSVSDECYAEILLRQQRAGAVAVMAMTRNSFTGYNDLIVFGFFKAIWPDFAPNPPWSSPPPIPAFTPVRLLRMGQILNFGKMFMAKAYSADTKRQLEFEMGHLHGDPEMPIWRAAPENLTVGHPIGIGATGPQEFIVKVTNASGGQAVQGAAVVLTRSDAILQIQETGTTGVARFSVNDIGAGDLDITVTCIGFRPYLGVITVKASGAELNRLDPADGPENQTIHVGGQGFQAGESVDLYFGSTGPTTVNADAAGQFGQATPTVDLTVPVGYAHGLVNIWAKGRTSGCYATRIFQVRDLNPVDLWTYDQWDDSTWSLHPGDNPTWDSPDIQLYDQSGNSADSANLTFGETYTVRVMVRNKEAFPAAGAKVVFKWENFGAGGPWQTFDTKTDNVPAGPAAVKNFETTYTPQATGHLCLKVELEHIEDTKPQNNAGQENLHVGYTSSPAQVRFMVWNRTKQPMPVHFEVRQLIDPKRYKKERIWATDIKHPDPQILASGARGKACVIIDPDPADVKPGMKAEFAVTAFIANQMIGGVNAIITKKK